MLFTFCFRSILFSVVLTVCVCWTLIGTKQRKARIENFECYKQKHFCLVLHEPNIFFLQLHFFQFLFDITIFSVIKSCPITIQNFVTTKPRFFVYTIEIVWHDWLNCYKMCGNWNSRGFKQCHNWVLILFDILETVAVFSTTYLFSEHQILWTLPDKQVKRCKSTDYTRESHCHIYMIARC